MEIRNFKVIAVKPLSGCLPAYKKILAENIPYYLFRNCHIEENESLTLTEPFLPADFFNIEGIQLEVSAIVGKNGSGKSTIVELILMAVNNLAYERFQRGLIYIVDLRVDIYFLAERFYKLHIDGTHAEIMYFSEKNQKMVLAKQFNFRQFFYSIAVNYSHYAYNSLDYKRNQRWLEGVFHKNDGYQIPLVLNPFRQNGNININSENLLVRQRLLANLLRPPANGFDYRQLTDRFRASYISLKPDKKKGSAVIYMLDEKGDQAELKLEDLDIDRERILRYLNQLFPFGLRKALSPHNRLAVDYLLRKLVNICLKYEEYRSYFVPKDKKFKSDALEEFLTRIIEDGSHIAYKVKQTLNYIRFDHIDPEKDRLELDDFGKRIYEIMADRQNRIGELIELLPPPIFSTQLIVRNVYSGEEVSFAFFSSGEKQWSHSTSNVLYHLNNLDSVARGRGKRLFYNRVVIILEEVELYFHPEMQRKYVQHVIRSIAQLHLKNITHVHLCFVTHSPMILSDIPAQNILFLNEFGKPADETHITETFGGNIHELLARSFFLDQALIGEFARRKIEWIIDCVKPNSIIILKDEQRQELLRTIRLIGEDFLRDKLLEMYAERFEESDVDAEIRELEERLKKLRNDRS